MPPTSARTDARGAGQRLLVSLDLAPLSSFHKNSPNRFMHIQRATPDALEAIKQLLFRLDLPHSDLTPSHLEHFFVCREGGDLVGVVGLELYGKTALLRSLAVHPEHRNEGIGARLSEKVEQHGRRNGVHEVYLLTTTAADYFERRDYETIERDELPEAIQETEEATQLCPSSAVCMRKHLRAPEGESED